MNNSLNRRAKLCAACCVALLLGSACGASSDGGDNSSGIGGGFNLTGGVGFVPGTGGAGAKAGANSTGGRSTWIDGFATGGAQFAIGGRNSTGIGTTTVKPQGGVQTTATGGAAGTVVNCVTGTLNCPCYTSGLCSGGMICNASKVCVNNGAATGGAPGTGGVKAAGGALFATGGAAQTATGGRNAAGGRNATGGAPSTGGLNAAGGAASSGATCAACAIQNCTSDVTDCSTDLVCLAALPTYLDCLDQALASGSHKAANRCDTAFTDAASGGQADALATCVHDNACSNVCQ